MDNEVSIEHEWVWFMHSPVETINTKIRTEKSPAGNAHSMRMIESPNISIEIENARVLPSAPPENSVRFRYCTDVTQQNHRVEDLGAFGGISEDPGHDDEFIHKKEIRKSHSVNPGNGARPL